MIFSSVYAKTITDYIDLKRRMGYKFRDVEYIFLQFDRLTVKMGIDTIGLTKELSDAWCQRRPNETEATQYIRIKYISVFSKYLNGIGYSSYVPQSPKMRYTFSAYVFTHDEIISLFEACDKYADSKLQKSRYSFLPILIRLLYCTGIRLHEALSIRLSDLNFENQTITIYNTKNGDDRIIPFRDTLLPYLERLTALSKDTNSDNLFPLNGKYSTAKAHIGEHFREILDIAGIVYKGKHIGPRIHDLRHTFACHSLKQLDDAGIDIYAGLPVLAAFLGHRSMDGTEKYVKLTSEVFPEIIEKSENLNSNLFPKLKNNSYETN